MKTLEELKDRYARSFGNYERWSDFETEYGDKNEYNELYYGFEDVVKAFESEYKSRVSELERENVQQKEWLEAYKKSNAEFMKSTTDQKFEIQRLEKEVETLRKVHILSPGGDKF